MQLIDRTKRVLKGAFSDNITGEAAKAAYYFFLSLFPMILALFALTGILGGTTAFEFIMNWLTSVLPDGATEYLEQFVREITDQQRPGALSLGLLLAIWSGSNFFAALGDGLDVMFNVGEHSKWWKKRLKAILLMALSAILLGGGSAALLAGPRIASALGLGAFVGFIVWPLAFLLVVAMFFLTYYIMPAHDQAGIRRELLIGAVVGAGIWLIAAAAFRLYVANFASYSATYGFVGGIIVLMLWLYLTAFAVLLGGEVADMLAAERHAGEASGPGTRAEPV
jgi:membrane protein